MEQQPKDLWARQQRDAKGGRAKDKAGQKETEGSPKAKARRGPLVPTHMQLVSLIKTKLAREHPLLEVDPALSRCA
jgi:hypothetical protein